MATNQAPWNITLFIDITLFVLLYNLIHLSPLTLLTYRLAAITVLQFRVPSTSLPPIPGPHLPSSDWSANESVYFRWLNHVKYSEVKIKIFEGKKLSQHYQNSLLSPPK